MANMRLYTCLVLSGSFQIDIFWGRNVHILQSDIFSARCDYKSSQSLQSLPGWQEETFGIALNDDNFMIGVDIT